MKELDIASLNRGKEQFRNALHQDIEIVAYMFEFETGTYYIMLNVNGTETACTFVKDKKKTTGTKTYNFIECGTYSDNVSKALDVLKTA